MKIKISIIMLAIAGLLMLNVGLISAQEPATVSGTVTDATTGKRIKGAEVTVDGSNPSLSATTDAHGDYSISDVPVDGPSFTASADGYQSETAGVVSATAGAIINFTLQPLDEALAVAELEVEVEVAKVAGTRHGYVGTYTVTGATPSTANFNATNTVTGAGTSMFFVTTKRGEEIEIRVPIGGLESVTKTPARPGRILADGDRVAVLVEFMGEPGSLIKVAIQVVVKPDKPVLPTSGAVVGITTDENGVRTVIIMHRNGKVKELELGPEAELPEVGDLVTAFQGRGRGANGAAVAKGIVRAEKVRQRLEGFLEDLTSEDGDLPPQALEHRAQRVAAIAALLEDHASNHVAIIQQVSQNENLPPQAVAGMLNKLERALSGLVQAKARGKEAKTKAGPPPGKGQNQGGRGNKK